MTASPLACGVWSWFDTLASEGYFEQLLKQRGLRMRKRVYWVSVVFWLMIYQRLHADASLQAAVLALPARWKGRVGRVSAATGAYCQARRRLPTLVAEQVSDDIFATLRSHAPRAADRPVFLVDGTTLRLEHEPDLVKAFPPGRNDLGDNRWPVLLLVAFHDAHSGLAARPSWGPMYGAHAVSEQRLAAEALDRLPPEARVVADANFGIFAFAHAVVRSGRQGLFRLTEVRARKILGQLPKKSTHRAVVWTPSAYERAQHPDLPADAELRGWVLTCAHPGKQGQKLYLFSTEQRACKQALALYKLRWNIETDLRNLKRTVNLHQIRSHSPALVEKELLVAVTAYNLVRAVMFRAAQFSSRTPRQMSFAHTQAAVWAALPGLEQAASPRQRERRMRALVELAAQLALPKRKRKRRAYPRQVWKRGGSLPIRRVHAPESSQ